jgi:hypothetical protein
MDDKRNTGQDNDDQPVRDDRSAESDSAGSSADTSAICPP